jgi:hypothetical protein
MQRHPVAVPLDQHDGAQPDHLTVRCTARLPVNNIRGILVVLGSIAGSRSVNRC